MIFVYIFDFLITLSYCVKSFKYFMYSLYTLTNIFLNVCINLYSILDHGVLDCGFPLALVSFFRTYLQHSFCCCCYVIFFPEILLNNTTSLPNDFHVECMGGKSPKSFS